MDLRQHLQSRQLEKELHDDLMYICTSSHWLEDMIDYFLDLHQEVLESWADLDTAQKDAENDKKIRESLQEQVKALTAQLVEQQVLEAQIEEQKALILKGVSVGGIQIKVDR